MKQFYKKKGFTLLELMIVIIIVGILASLALPRFITATKKAKESEARGLLGAIRSSQLRYYVEHNNAYHVDADLSDGSGLDIDITDSQYYTYQALDGTVLDVIAEADVQAGVTGIDALEIEIDGTISVQ